MDGVLSKAEMRMAKHITRFLIELALGLHWWMGVAVYAMSIPNIFMAYYQPRIISFVPLSHFRNSSALYRCYRNKHNDSSGEARLMEGIAGKCMDLWNYPRCTVVPGSATEFRRLLPRRRVRRAE